MRLRSYEWLLIGFFVYVAGLAPFYSRPGRNTAAPFVMGGCAVLLILALAAINRRGFVIARDWIAPPLVLLAYREMDWFTPARLEHRLEHAWIVWDRMLLDDWAVRRVIEFAGWVPHAYLEFGYLLVYGIPAFTIAVMYVWHRRDLLDRVLFVYLLGTLLAYALFPFFPSEPPRTVFPGADLPGVMSAFRRFNLYLVRGYGIHSSVFPSAHVSSAFSAAWAVLLFVRSHRRFGWAMLFYAVSVSLATVYGRYHYAVDAVAGLGISLVALAVGTWIKRRSPASSAK